MNEIDKQNEDAERIFTAVSTSGALDYKDAERMVVMFYVPDMSFSRGGISLALTKLEKFWKEKSDGQS